MSGISGAGGFRPNVTSTERNIAKAAGIGAAAGAAALGPVGAAAGAAAGAAIEAVKEISKKDTSSINKLNTSKTPVKEVSFDLDNKIENKSTKPADTFKNIPNLEKKDIDINTQQQLKAAFMNFIQQLR